MALRNGIARLGTPHLTPLGRALNSVQDRPQDSTSYAVGWKLPLYETRGLQAGRVIWQETT